MKKVYWILSLLLVMTNFLGADTTVSASETRTQSITKLYIAVFNRAPDSAGLDYWVKSDFSLDQIAMSFFDQEETQLKYPPELSVRSFVREVYLNLFNREPDLAGLDYWSKAIESGEIHRSVFILAVINGALGTDATILENKKTIGLYFVNSGLDNYEGSVCVMSEVTADYKTVGDAMDKVDRLSEGGSCIEEPKPDPKPDPDPDPTPIPNTPPTANAGPSLSTDLETPITVTGTGTDTDGVIISYLWREGQSVLAYTAEFEYIPLTEGEHNLTLIVTDNDGSIGTDTLTIQVLPTDPTPPANTPPTATNATADVAYGETVTYDLASHINDAETADSGLTIIVVTEPTKGSLSWSGTVFTFTATPASGVYGDDTFTYEVKDPQGSTSAPATVTITNIFEDGF